MNLLEKLMQFEIHNEDNPDIIAKFGAIHIALLSLASNKVIHISDLEENYNV